VHRVLHAHRRRSALRRGDARTHRAPRRRHVGLSPTRRHDRAPTQRRSGRLFELATRKFKNQYEHSVPVNEIVTALASVYDDVHAESSPSIVALRTLAHLGTWINASSRCAADAPDALAVLRLLHPTSAVGGVPRQSAYELIQRLEQHDRGYYAGPLGWIDANGDGEWWIGFRGIEVKVTSSKRGPAPAS